MTAPTDHSPPLAVVLNRDLLFGSRIRNALTALGVEALFVASTEQFVTALNERRDATIIGIIDMNGAVSWDVLTAALANGDCELAPTLAFGPHVDAEGRRAAKAAGVSRIVSNGQFHADMAGLIDRYRRHRVEERMPTGS